MMATPRPSASPGPGTSSAPDRRVTNVESRPLGAGCRRQRQRSDDADGGDRSRRPAESHGIPFRPWAGHVLLRVLGPAPRAPPTLDRRRSAGEHHQVVAVDHLVGHAGGQVAGVPADDGPQVAASTNTMPRAKVTPSVPGPRPCHPRRTTRHLDDAGRQQGASALDERPARARRRRSPCPATDRRTRSRACGPAACAGGPERRADAAVGDGVGEHPGPGGVGDHRAHSRPRRDPCRRPA